MLKSLITLACLSPLTLFGCSAQGTDMTSTASFTIPRHDHVDVIGRVGVPLWAMSFAAHVDTSVAAKGIDSLRDGVQVMRVYAARSSASVIEHKFIGDGSAKKSIGNAVSSGSESHFTSKLSISRAVAVCHPDPATGFGDHFNFVKKAFYDGLSHVTPSSRIGQAHETLLASLWAVSILPQIFDNSLV